MLAALIGRPFFWRKSGVGTIGFPTMPCASQMVRVTRSTALSRLASRELFSLNIAPISAVPRGLTLAISTPLPSVKYSSYPALMGARLKHMHGILQMRAPVLKPIGPLLRRLRSVNYGLSRLMLFCIGITLHGIPHWNKKKRPRRCCPISRETTSRTSGLTVATRSFLHLSVVQPITLLLIRGLY